MPYSDPVRRRAYHAAYNAAHREKRLAYYAAYYAAHREDRRAYHAAHREERRAYHAAYYAAHREKRLAYYAAYNAAHREERRAYWHKADGGYIQQRRQRLRHQRAALLEQAIAGGFDEFIERFKKRTQTQNGASDTVSTSPSV